METGGHQHRLRRAVVLVAGGIAIAAVAGGVVLSNQSSSASSRTSSERALNISCRSGSLGGRLPAVVYLPAGYSRSATRYPVIYFLHGLPADPDQYTTNSFVAHAVADARRRAIVVMPQASRAKDSDREYLDWATDENWPKAIANDLPNCVDARFRTIANRRGRALIGLSAGGFGAFNIGLRHLGTFAALESWSGYFAATDPTGTIILDFGSRRANRRARVPRGQRLAGTLERNPTFIGFYVGRQDPTFVEANVMLDQAFTAQGISHRFAIYPGAHSRSLWEEWAPLWLSLALNHLSAPIH